MFSLRKNIYHRPKIRTKSEFCALDHGERTIAVMLLCVRTPYDRRLKRTQTVFIQNFYRRSNCLSLLLLFSFFFLSKRKKNIVSPLKREKGGLCAGSQKTKNPRPQKRDGSMNFRGTTRFLWEYPITLLTPITGHFRIQLLSFHCIRSKVKGDIHICGLFPANGRPLCGK